MASKIVLRMNENIWQYFCPCGVYGHALIETTVVRFAFVTYVNCSPVVNIIVHFAYPRIMIVVSTFVAKITEYLWSWWFFIQTSFDFLISHVDGIFLISFKRYCCLELKLEIKLTRDHFL